ncbi:MAG: 8-amino-7-oxononanoate synthase [Polyangia bacterium]|jgi:8-amino-7-oxononanoate synthase|nr:8-amino-7-oxononanoate synthase [Polyangia bacterium]
MEPKHDRLVQPPDWTKEELRLLSEKGLLRKSLTVLGREPGCIRLPGSSLTDFTSNDYLGLSQHPACVEGACRASREHGCSAGSSRIVTGCSSLVSDLESAVSSWLEVPSAVLFPSGYQANVGVISALVGKGDLVFSDSLNHASIVDGCRLSGADIRIFQHLNASGLQVDLESAPKAQRKLVVTDSLFSMDGAKAPLLDLHAACQHVGALLVVDEAHALGVQGPCGRGLCSELGVEPTLRIGTFSKAVGSHGAFAAGDPTWIQYLQNKARALIYTTALPPACLGASLAAIGVLDSSEGDTLRSILRRRSDQTHSLIRDSGARVSGAESPIACIGFDDPNTATLLQEHLFRSGCMAWAFRPPTVPSGTSLLRVSLSAAHSEEQVSLLGRSIMQFLKPRQ